MWNERRNVWWGDNVLDADPGQDLSQTGILSLLCIGFAETAMFLWFIISLCSLCLHTTFKVKTVASTSCTVSSSDMLHVHMMPAESSSSKTANSCNLQEANPMQKVANHQHFFLSTPFCLPRPIPTLPGAKLWCVRIVHWKQNRCVNL